MRRARRFAFVFHHAFGLTRRFVGRGFGIYRFAVGAGAALGGLIGHSIRNRAAV